MTIFPIILASILLFGFVQAADFNIAPTTGNLGLRQEFSVNIKINTGDDSINAAQAKIKFNPDILEVEGISKDGSTFNFWLQEPKFSNTDGTIEFIGGTTSGVSGASLQVLKIKLATKVLDQASFLLLILQLLQLMEAALMF